MQNVVHLMSAQEIESALGSAYFYRQRIYRMAEAGKITAFKRKESTVFLGNLVLKAFLRELEDKLISKFPEIDIGKLSIFYDDFDNKRIVVDGLFGKAVYVDADKETEEDLLTKISHIVEWIEADSPSPQDSKHQELIQNNSESISLVQTTDASSVLPEEITWVKVVDDVIEGVPIKSHILVSLSSIAQFVGVRTDHILEWLYQSTFADYLLSAHYKQIQTPDISGVWKKGVVSGKTPYIPFEILPELLVTFRQSGRTVSFPQKAELLYNIAKSVLEVVGLAVSGNRDVASQELARAGQMLGLTVADQIIGIFKQYESRDFQVNSAKDFASKAKKQGEDYAVLTGKLTLGVTERSASQWKALGSSRNLPATLRSSGREVMRQLSTSDSVGVTFGEQHYIKDPKIEEAIATGRLGKQLHKRLKDVGILNENTTKVIDQKTK